MATPGDRTLDLAAYLDRIGLPRPAAPDLDALRALQAAHIAAIGFDDLECALGGIPDVGLDAVQDKLVTRRRGGWCHEHVVLFAAVLRALGYDADRVLADMRPGRGGPATHALVHVRLPTGDVLADVGLGAGPLEPLALAESAPRPTLGGWPFGLEHVEGERWRLLTRRDGAVATVHELVLRPVTHAELAEGNRQAATHPDSPFPGRVIAMQRTPQEHRRLVNRALTVTTPGGAEHREELTTDAALALLAGRFAIALQDGDERAAVRAVLDASPC